MKRYAKWILLLFITSSCATIVTGTSQEVSFDSEPRGVEVSVGGKVLGTTPFTIKMDKKKDQNAEFTLAGYKKQTRPLATKMEGWFWGNIIFGGLIGSTTDAMSGSIHEYSPNKYYVTMISESASPMDELRAERAAAKEFIVLYYDNIMADFSAGGGNTQDSLVHLLKIDDKDKAESLKKIQSLADDYSDIPEFAEQVVNQFMPGT